MVHRLIILLSILSLHSLLAGQGSLQEYPDRKGKFFLVPEFWLSFGTQTYIDIAPMAGYHVTDRYSVGLGPHYIYQSWKSTPYQSPGETHIFGLKTFMRFALITHAEEYLPFHLFSDLFVHLEYEGMSLDSRYYGSTAENGRYLYHALLAGGGISQRFGLYNSVSIMILWNVNESSSSPYTNPLLRVGFNTYF